MPGALLHDSLNDSAKIKKENLYCKMFDEKKKKKENLSRKFNSVCYTYYIA